MKFKVNLNEVSTLKGFILVVGGVATLLFLIFTDKESAEFVLGGTVALAGLVGVGVSDSKEMEPPTIVRLHQRIDELNAKLEKETQ